MWQKTVRNRLTVKLFLLILIMLLFVCALTYGLIDLWLPGSYKAVISDELTQQAEQLAQDAQTMDDAALDAALAQFALETSTFVTLFNLETMESKTYGKSTLAEDATGQGPAESETFAVSIVRNGKETLGVSISGTMAQSSTASTALRGILPWLSLAVLLVSALGAIALARYVTRPIVRLSGISRRLAALDFSWDTGIDRTDEIGVLADHLKALAVRLRDALGALEMANQQLRRDVESEKALQQKRTAFFRSVSHELKTPLTVLRAQLEGMLDGVGVYQDHTKYLGRALSVVTSMEAMVLDILSVARAEGEAKPLSIGQVDLAALIRQRAAAFHDLMRRRGITLTMTLSDTLPVSTDAERLGTVLDNLIANAVKHSPQGSSVTISAQKSEGGVTVTVENTGAHIPEEMLTQVFEPFFRVDASRTRDTGGTGLGLYIVKTLLEQLHADFAMESTPGGVRFTFTLPG